MELETFLSLQPHQIRELVEQDGPSVCVFPVNGTRRWFILEAPKEPEAQSHDAYAQTFVTRTGEEVRRLTGLIFTHGVNTVIMPVYGTELATRGAAYRQMAEAGLLMLTDPAFHAFYADMNIRVRFYGNYRTHYADAPHLLAAFEETEARTRAHTGHRLFYGVCAESATQHITQAAVERGHALTDDEAVEIYYGEPVKAADLFVGFDRPTTFDMPLLDNGDVALYFTVAPSPYLEAEGLRVILYDWLFIRRGDGNYEDLEPADWQQLQRFYHANRNQIIGVGTRHRGIWHPQNVVKTSGIIA